MLRRPTALVLAGWLVLAAIVVAVEAPPAGEPGLNYDEAFWGQEARDFLEPGRITQHPPSERSTWVLGRRFPLRNAAYLGALKSQLLIPAFALFGANARTLRMATLATALVSLLLLMLWARRVFGMPTALAGGALVAFDPSFVFFGTCEWGPFTTLLLCRCAGLLALTAGWQTRRTAWVAAGALALGLGVYARADFVLIGMAAAAGLVAARGRTLLDEIRERRGASAAAVVALVVGSSPMLASAVDLLRVQSGIADRGDLAYRAQVLWSTLDGSYYDRVIAVGGLFEHMFEAGAPGNLFGFALVLALPAGAWLALRRREPVGVPRAGIRFLVVTVCVLGAAMVALPGAVRAHHMLNLMPFTQLLVAAVAVALAGSRAGRLAAGLALVAILASSAYVTAQTRALVSETGGRGRYSNALDAYAAEIDGDSGVTVVSLDWGFHETLQFLTTGPRLEEPIWTIPRLLAAGRPWIHAGDASHRYLVFAPRYDLFQLGPRLLAAARALPPEDVEIRAHRDRQGEVVFYSVRFPRPHQLIYTGTFQIRFR